MVAATEQRGAVPVAWPAESNRRAELHRDGRPCLLLVDPDADPPLLQGCLEDWIRLPASSADIQARSAALSLRAERHRRDPDSTVSLDDGVFRVGDGWVAVPPVESRLLAALLERSGAVVSRAALVRAGWPGEDPDRNSLDVHMGRLRRRLTQVGLQVVTVRSRGYLLDV